MEFCCKKVASRVANQLPVLESDLSLAEANSLLRSGRHLGAFGAYVRLLAGHELQAYRDNVLLCLHRLCPEPASLERAVLAALKSLTTDFSASHEPDTRGAFAL